MGNTDCNVGNGAMRCENAKQVCGIIFSLEQSIIMEKNHFKYALNVVFVVGIIENTEMIILCGL